MATHSATYRQCTPTSGGSHCRYAAEWVATKLRWHLAVDTTERAALHGLANACPDQTVSYEPAP
ncbi:hypothetical protein [Streptomyces sp. NWU49]|uniref:hypothetical protein n=1 Tax=Streptomyces sp. NWU49 TaxID=2201153 RepID=UPI0011B5F0C8